MCNFRDGEAVSDAGVVASFGDLGGFFMTSPLEIVSQRVDQLGTGVAAFSSEDGWRRSEEKACQVFFPSPSQSRSAIDL